MFGFVLHKENSVGWLQLYEQHKAVTKTLSKQHSIFSSGAGRPAVHVLLDKHPGYYRSVLFANDYAAFRAFMEKP